MAHGAGRQKAARAELRAVQGRQACDFVLQPICLRCKPGKPCAQCQAGKRKRAPQLRETLSRTAKKAKGQRVRRWRRRLIRSSAGPLIPKLIGTHAGTAWAREPAMGQGMGLLGCRNPLHAP